MSDFYDGQRAASPPDPSAAIGFLALWALIGLLAVALSVIAFVRLPPYGTEAMRVVAAGNQIDPWLLSLFRNGGSIWAMQALATSVLSLWILCRAFQCDRRFAIIACTTFAALPTTGIAFVAPTPTLLVAALIINFVATFAILFHLGLSELAPPVGYLRHCDQREMPQAEMLVLFTLGLLTLAVSTLGFYWHDLFPDLIQGLLPIAGPFVLSVGVLLLLWALAPLRDQRAVIWLGGGVIVAGFALLALLFVSGLWTWKVDTFPPTLDRQPLAVFTAALVVSGLAASFFLLIEVHSYYDGNWMCAYDQDFYELNYFAGDRTLTISQPNARKAGCVNLALRSKQIFWVVVVAAGLGFAVQGALATAAVICSFGLAVLLGYLDSAQRAARQRPEIGFFFWERAFARAGLCILFALGSAVSAHLLTFSVGGVAGASLGILLGLSALALLVGTAALSSMGFYLNLVLVCVLIGSAINLGSVPQTLAKMYPRDALARLVTPYLECGGVELVLPGETPVKAPTDLAVRPTQRGAEAITHDWGTSRLVLAVGDPNEVVQGDVLGQLTRLTSWMSVETLHLRSVSLSPRCAGWLELGEKG